MSTTDDMKKHCIFVRPRYVKNISESLKAQTTQATLRTHLHRQRCRPVAPTASRSRTSIASHRPIALTHRLVSSLCHFATSFTTYEPVSPRDHMPFVVVVVFSSASFRVDARLAECTLRPGIATDRDPSCMRIASKGGRHSLPYFVLCKSIARASLNGSETLPSLQT